MLQQFALRVLSRYHDSRGNVSSQDVWVLEKIVLEDMPKMQVKEAALQVFVSRHWKRQLISADYLELKLTCAAIVMNTLNKLQP